MAGRRRSQEELPETGPADVPDEALAEGPGPSLSLFDASGDNRIRLLRRDDKTQKWIPHGYLPPNATEETVLTLFGGGRYWTQLLVREGGTGKEVVKTQRNFELTGPYIPPRDGLPGIHKEVDATGRVAFKETIPIPSSIPGLPSSNDLMQALNAGVISSVIDLLGKMKEAGRNPAPPATDPMLLELLRQQSAMQTKMFEMIIPLLTGGIGGKGDSKKEIIELITQLKDVLTPNQPAVNPSDPNAVLTGIVSAIKQLREVSDELTPERNNGTGDPMMDAFPKVVEILAEEQRLRKEQNVPKVPVKPQPKRIPETTTGGEGQPVASEIPLWRRVIQAEGPRLLNAAQRGQEPELIAKMAVTFAPPEIKGIIAEFFHREAEEVIEQMFVEVPALRDHKEWVGQFVEQIQFLLFPEEFDEIEETTDLEPQAGGKPNGSDS